MLIGPYVSQVIISQGNYVMLQVPVLAFQHWKPRSSKSQVKKQEGITMYITFKGSKPDQGTRENTCDDLHHPEKGHSYG